MSKCISREGEYSEHTLIGDGEHCDYCGELDLVAHDRAVEAKALRKAAAHLRDTATELGPEELAYINCTRMDANELERLAEEIEGATE